MIGRLGPRLALGGGVLLVVVALVVEMSGSAPRMAGSDHISTPVFAATVPGGGVLCQPVRALPNDIASVRLLVGTYGHPAPALSIRFTSASGVVVAAGSRPAGGPQGDLTIALAHVAAPARAVKACLHVAGTSRVAIGGESSALGTEVVNGKRQPGDISLIFLRAGSESWWQLLPTLITRFGLGKAPFFGDWTLPAAALVLLGIWVAAIRLLLRELA